MGCTTCFAKPKPGGHSKVGKALGAQGCARWSLWSAHRRGVVHQLAVDLHLSGLLGGRGAVARGNHRLCARFHSRSGVLPPRQEIRHSRLQSSKSCLLVTN
eukprot:scaffold33947_cov63-Phaeocystis_antarctica.AAC.4